MKAHLLFFTLMLAAAQAGRAQDAGADTLDAANRAYNEGHYDQAARQFQDLIRTRGFSAALCFDLANSEAKAGRIGPAILNYERARYLAPSDHDIDHNLQLARQQAGLKSNSLRWWQIMIRSLTINQWLAIVDFWLALLALAVIANFFVNRMTPGPSRRVAGKTVKTTIFVTIPCFLFTAYLAGLAAPMRIEGVVMSKDAALRISPFDAAEQIGTLPEGELVTVEEKHDDYFRIEARDGRYGWMTRHTLESVIAGSFDPGDGK